MYNKILLAVDGSEHSIRATDEAVKMAKLSNGAKVEIVYVVDFSKAKSEVLHSQGQEDLEVARKKRLLPVEQRLDRNGIEFEVKILHGEPGPEIVDFANENQFDLVVVGSRGLNSLQEMVLGSVSHKVVKRVNCPVLIVK